MPHRQGLGGNDTIDAWRGGDDILDGGTGNDVITAGAGNDVLIGGDGQDLLRGNAGDDRLYAANEITVATALAQQNATASGQKGDFLDGGAGSDTLAGDTGNDVLMGGDGTDLMLGGTGDDTIYGDVETGIVGMDWTAQRTVTTSGNVATYDVSISDTTFTLPTQGGADVIYGGAGDDTLTGEAANDIQYAIRLERKAA